MSGKFSLTRLPSSRRTVVDLLRIVGGKAVPAYIVIDLDSTWVNTFIQRSKNKGHRLTVTSILMKAIGLAQQNHPLSRTELTAIGKTVTYHDIVGGITIERDVDGQKTVFFGEIESPDTKSIYEIAHELREYSKVAIEKSAVLKLQGLFAAFPYFLRFSILKLGIAFPFLRLQCQKATFGLTSLGKFGMNTVLSPCICTSTFAVGTIEDRVTAKNNVLSIRSMMTVSFSFDHRVIDPNSAARFVDDVRRLMEGGLQPVLEDNSSRAEIIAC